MQLTYDFYNRLQQTKLILANPQKSKIGLLSGIEELGIKPFFNSISELSFRIYKTSNGEINKYYDRIMIGKLVEARYIGWFQVKQVNEKQDVDSKVKYKEITCLSLENELIYKRVDAIDGVYGLYDVTDTEHSLLHIIAQYCNWNIGHVSNSLVSKWRTFSIDSEKIYNLTTTDIAKSFNCIFQFNTYEKSINAYTLDEIGELTNITISDKNILQSYVKESDLDKIITKMKIKGGTNADGTQFDCRAVNPTGMDYIINVDYYMTLEWMSQSLINALNAYKIKYNNYQTTYSSTLSTLKVYQTELTTLESELDTLESERDAYISTYKSYVAIHDRVPRSSDAEYQLYINAYNSAQSKQTAINSKNSAITAKEAQITSTKTTLNNIGSDLNMSSNFTSPQLDELDSFLIEGDDYEDDTFIATNTMSEEDIIELKLELYNNAQSELARASRPQYTISTTISNLYTIVDDIDSKISYDSWRENFVPGNIITLKFRDDYAVQVRLMSLDFKFNSKDEMDATFSDKTRLDDELIQLGEILAQADRTSSAFSLSKFGYDEASKQTSTVRDFMNGTLNATLNRIISDDHIQTELSEYGIINRKWLEDQNAYDVHQSWLTQNVLLFTDDNWQSSKTGIGFFTNGAQTFYGVIADVIVGNMVLTEALNVTNQNNSIVMNKDGAIFTNCDITITKGVNTLTLNATDGIKLTKSGVSQFYIDGSGNLKLAGDLVAGSININNKFTVDSAGNCIASALTVTGGSFSIGGRFSVDSSGNLTANNASFTNGEFSGAITSSTINIDDHFKVSSSGVVTINSNSLIVNSTNFSLTSDGTLACTNGNFNGNINGGTINIGNGNFTVNSFGDFYAASAKFAGINNRVTIDDDGISVKDDSTGEILSRIWINSMQTSYVECNYMHIADIDNILITSDNDSIYDYVARKSHDHYELVDGDAVRWNGEKLFPWSTADLGDSTHRWGSIYANDGTINTSDRNLKHDIEDLPEIYKKLILKLKPVRFKYNDGTSDRYHTGFISQDVEEAMNELGIESQDFGGFIKSPTYAVMDENGTYDITSEINGYIYMLRYEEFISPTINLVQEQHLKINELENRLINIENKLA